MRHPRLPTTLAVILLSANVQAAPFTTVPDHAELCPPGVATVDRAKLARALLTIWPLSASALEAASGDQLSRETYVKALVFNCRKGTPGCTDADVAQMETIQQAFERLKVGGWPGFALSARDTSLKTYFESKGRDPAVQCLAPVPPPPHVPDSAQPPSISSRIRIRGNADDLYIPQRKGGKTTHEFTASSSATANFSDDGVAHKQIATLTAYVGFALTPGAASNDPTGPLTSTTEIIPYVGADRSAVRTGRGAGLRTSISELVNPGMLVHLRWFVGDVTHDVNIRPNIQSDLQSNAVLARTTVQYLPVITGQHVNSYVGDRIELPGLPLYWTTIFDLRTDIGTWTDKGTGSDAASNHDYVRLGGQAGFAVISDNENLPLIFKTTYTGLYAASGRVNVGDFSAALTLPLDKDKLFGITASYTNGVAYEGGKRDNLWKIGLSAHF